jgi:Zn-dependent M16 (insulinase) family peptidase
MHDMNEHFEERIDAFVGFAKDMISRTVSRAGATVSVTASEPADISRLIGMLAPGNKRPEAAVYTSPLPRRFGIRVPASVSHSVQAYDLAEMGIRSSGSISVAANILTFAYLWNEVRVKGGAYGTSASVNRTGSMFCYSYRDPSPAVSLGVYKNAAAFLKEFAGGGEADLDGFIISTIASTEPLVSPASRGRSADDFVMSGFTDEDRIRVRREILQTSSDDLLSWCDAFEKLATDGCVCVIGPDSALESIPELEIADI